MSFSRNMSLMGSAIAIAIGGVAFAASHTNGNHDAAIKARKAHMQLNSFNLGMLGAMSKGEMPFDAAMATAAAERIAAMSAVDWTGYYPEGSSSDMGDTRALPAIWSDMDDFAAKQQALADAAATLAASTGTLEDLQANFGAVGGACGDCHKAFRQPS